MVRDFDFFFFFGSGEIEPRVAHICAAATVSE